MMLIYWWKEKKVANIIPSLIRTGNWSGEELDGNPDVVERVAEAGHKRFLKDHESKVRLSKLLEDIMK